MTLRDLNTPQRNPCRSHRGLNGNHALLTLALNPAQGTLSAIHGLLNLMQRVRGRTSDSTRLTRYRLLTSLLTLRNRAHDTGRNRCFEHRPSDFSRTRRACQP
jgi:hypothetical protein